MDDVISQVKPKQAAALHDLAKRTNRSILIVAIVVAVLLMTGIALAGPALAGALVGVSGLLGVGLALAVGRPFVNMRKRLGLSATEAQAVIRQERLRRKGK